MARTKNKRLKIFKVEAMYVYQGSWNIRATSKNEAKELAKTQCGVLLGKPHTTLGEEGCPNWDFDIHPVKESFK